MNNEAGSDKIKNTPSQSFTNLNNPLQPLTLTFRPIYFYKKTKTACEVNEALAFGERI